MNLSAEGINIIEVEEEIIKLRQLAHNNGADKQVRACNAVLKIVRGMIVENAIKNVKF